MTKRRSDEWLKSWLKSPDKMLASDEAAKAMLKQFNGLPMPNQNLDDAEIRQFLKYFHWADASGVPKAATK